MYLNSSWPIKFATLSSSGNSIAIAGSHGFAHYNMTTEKWIFFGDELEEKSFQVTGMLWYKSLLIVSCKVLQTKKFEIRIFSRDTKLGNSSVLHVEKFQNEISSMNLTDSHLLVYSKNCVMQSYLIYVVEGPKVVLQLRQAFSLAEFVGEDRDCVQGIARLRPSGQSSVEDLFQSPVLLLKNGFLYLIWKQESGWVATNLAEKVEHFWIAGSKIEDSDFQSSIWVFDGKGVKILSRPAALLDSTAVYDRKDTVFSMDLDFYPFVVLISEGVLVGIKQYLSLNKSLNISQFGPEIKTHLFVHLIMESFLARGQTARALSIKILDILITPWR
jgi:RAB6A-GEF complex partner protein 1